MTFIKMRNWANIHAAVDIYIYYMFFFFPEYTLSHLSYTSSTLKSMIYINKAI